ncbi:protein phosphatase 2C domain-containing protein [Bacillus tianshenii]|uniref:PP2C family protein-serine/threonine phosphatase n=1 Tax=Sutcliffiella tianshenii TaxID=1463404 RepID=UPI001CD7C894|nr:protein phosphatase 2C domain-containing protein [Bacillus tianshenii]MCA1321676.1 protein phosphatase 2C domain-containing protein [Bacillus tianshenii]
MLCRWSSFSKKGGRRYNEDNCIAERMEDSYLWVVADGMGGHHGGEVASQLAVESMLRHFERDPSVSKEMLEAHLLFANERIMELQNENAQFQNMQTTIVAALTNGCKTIIGHLGDSRCYLFRNGRIDFRTMDHSVVQMMVKQGEITEKDMRTHEDRNKVLKSLGKGGELKPSYLVVDTPLQTGDALLLCTDGFWEYVMDGEMEVDYYKSQFPEEWLGKMEKRLLGRAKKNHDNYTAMAVFVL